MGLNWIRILLFAGAFAAVAGAAVYVRHVIIENHDLKATVKEQKSNLAKLEQTRRLRESAITTEAVRGLDRQKRKDDLERKVEKAADSDVWNTVIVGLYGNP